MSSRLLNTLCVSSLTLLVSASVLADDAVSLRYKPPKAPLIYRTTTTFKQEQTINEMNFDSEMKAIDVSVWTFQREDSDGNLHWRCENKRLEVEGKIQSFGEYRYNSERDERERGTQLDAALTPIYEALTGAVYDVTLSPRGLVTAVKGYEDLVGELGKGDIFAAQYTLGGTDKGVRLAVQEGFAVLSESPVEPGHSWSAPYDMEIPGIAKVSGRKVFTYDGPKTVAGRTVARFSMAHEVTLEPAGEIAGLKTSGTLTTSETSGHAEFDPALGQLLSLTSHVTFTGNVTLEVGGNTFNFPTNQTWNVSVESLAEIPPEEKE